MIGVTFIIKDDSEVKYLRPLLKSLGFYAKHTTVTITNEPGDKIRKVCDEFGASYNFFKWVKDFAKARNFGIDNLPAKYDYVFTCDADDVIENVSKLGAVVKTMKELKAESCYIPYTTKVDKENGDSVINVIRLFKRGSGKYVRPIHEVYVPDGELRMADHRVRCIHTKDADQIEAGERRNLDALLAIKKKTDEDYRYIASSYLMFGEVDKALETLLKIKPDFGFYYDVRVTIARIYKHKRKLDKAVEVAEDLMNEYGDYANTYFHLGSYYILTKQYEKALATYLQGFEKPKLPQVATASSHDIFINPLGKVAFLYETLGMHDKALWVVEVLKKISPDLKKVKELEKLIKE
jgi:glycosyltransferase involved in cell wall biosynthesis